MSDATSTVEAILEVQAHALFNSYQLKLKPVGGPPTFPNDVTIAGMIGFAAPTVRGTMLIGSTFGVFATSRAVAMGETVSTQGAGDLLLVRDWAGELANQLLGRVKNRLGALGLTIRVSTPTALSGSALGVANPRSPRAWRRVVECSAGKIWLLWDAIYEPGFSLSDAPVGESVGEGDLVIF